MVVMESETEFKAKIKNSIQEQEFLSLLSPLTEEEKLVVRVLIKQNQATPLNTIRNEAVKEKALRRRDEILRRAREDAIKQEWKHREREREKARVNIIYETAPEQIYTYEYISKIFAKLETVEDFERALKVIKLGAPSLNIIRHAVDTLTRLPIPFVEVRPIVKGKRIKTLYYLSPVIYDVWKAQRNKISAEIPKGYKPLEDEEYWFML